MVWMLRCVVEVLRRLAASFHLCLLPPQLKAKRDAKYSLEEEAKVVAWIEELTGEKKEGAFAEWLKVSLAWCGASSAHFTSGWCRRMVSCSARR